jgi:hypothetical protein
LKVYKTPREMKASIPDIYIRNGMRFRAGGIQFKDNAFELKISFSRDLRRCDMCICRDVEDEQHVVFDCACYEDLQRDKRCVGFEQPMCSSRQSS